MAVSSCVLAVFFIGCDQSGSTSAVTIVPVSTNIDANKINIITFTAAGGDSNYTWELSNSSLGTLHTAGGTAIYQNTTNVGVNALKVVAWQNGSAQVALATVNQQ